MKKAIIIIFCMFILVPPLFSQSCTTGIWYSTWYIMNGHYIWSSNHGLNSENQFLADVNGDSKDDAVTYTNGIWSVSLSNGNIFNNPTSWISGHGVGSNQQFLSDFTGDGKADATVLFNGSGEVYISISNGTSFNGYTKWMRNFGIGAAKIMTGDVNGDKKADLISFLNGKWTVAISNGTTFDPPIDWINGHGLGSQEQSIGDFNGDGKADALVEFSNNGDLYVALSNGTSFNNYSKWNSSNIKITTSILTRDINNDLIDDVIFYDKSDGSWKVSYATNTNSFGPQKDWKKDHTIDAEKILIGDPLGEGKKAAVSFLNGVWKILPNSYYEAFYLNIWDAWGIKALPFTQGTYQQYDSGDSLVIREHFAELTTANIDYLLMDETNNIYVNSATIFNRAMTVAREMKKWNENPVNRPLRYAFAIGGIQFNGDPTIIEFEAKEVWNNVVNKAENGGQNTYYMLDRKPLLVCYYGQQSYLDAWKALSDHQWSDHFTLRWCNGTNQNTPDLFGWGIPNGSISSATLMEVMPGWNNHHGAFVSRTYNNSEGDFYRKLCWDRVLAKSPDQVIINSYNEFAEETALQKANTSMVTGNSEKWSSPNLYWDMTVNYIKQYKAAKNCKEPNVNFTSDKTFSSIPTNIQFTQQASEGFNYQWDFGDGYYSIEPNPIHYYAIQGTFTVKLKVTGSGNSGSIIKTNYISIGCTGPVITPFLQVNSGAWEQKTTATVCLGGSITLGPQPSANNWSWTGPNAYTANTREVVLNKLQAVQSGIYTAVYTDAQNCKASQEFNITADICTGIEEDINNREIKLYPSPAIDHFTIQNLNSTIDEIKITGIEGHLVYQSNEKINDNKMINVSNFNRGLYYITLTGENIKQVIKIILQ